MNINVDDILLASFVGALLGFSSCTLGSAIESKVHKYKLEKVRIKDICECKNTHSNWYEIVWEGKKCPKD